MDGGANPAYIDEAMEHLPLSAEPPNPAFRRRQCQWNHQDERGEAHRDERAFYDVLDDEIPREELIDADIDGKVHAGIKECEKAEHPSVLDHSIPTGEPAERGNSEREDEESQ